MPVATTMRPNGLRVQMRRSAWLLVFLRLFTQLHEVSSWTNWMGERGDEDTRVPEMDMNLLKSSYGVDVSFPTHHRDLAPALQSPFGTSVQNAYNVYLEECKKYYAVSPGKCDEWESKRIGRNLHQPASSHNFTTLGFAKMRAPALLRRRLRTLFDENIGNEIGERGREANTFFNQWDFFSYMIDIGRAKALYGEQIDLEKDIVQATLPILEEWTGTSLSPAAVYGIRIFIEGTILPPHVDLSPLAITAVLNVAQEPEDQPWPMELIGHDGKAYNVTMEPGDMVVYEGHSVIHGHPFQMEGSYNGYVYVHFEPNSVPYIRDRQDSADEEFGPVKISLKNVYKNAKEQKVDSNRNQAFPDFLDGTGEAPLWTQQYLYADVRHETPREHNRKLRQTIAHRAAAEGDLEALKEVGGKDVSLLHQEDANGWRPLHEAARAGSVEVIHYLVRNGADVNERTNNGKGGTPLWWAIQFHGESHESVELLKKLGGVAIKPQTDLL